MSQSVIMLNPWKYFVITGKITIVNLSVTINTLHNLYQLKLCDLPGFISLNIFRWKQSYRETFTKANWAKWMWASVPGLGQPVWRVIMQNYLAVKWQPRGPPPSHHIPSATGPHLPSDYQHGLLTLSLGLIRWVPTVLY